MSRFLALTAVFFFLLVTRSFACSTCADLGTVEKRDACGICMSKGRVPDQKSPFLKCPACNGNGRVGQFRKPCTACLGSGRAYTACLICEGTGIKVSRVLCPTCKGASAVSGIRGATVETDRGDNRDGKSVVDTVAVQACTQCDAKGNFSKKVTCEVCDHGWNHQKNNEGSYACRSCGAICKARFSICKCDKRDCPHCQDQYEKINSEVCPMCGGDKIITPLERERAQKGAGK